MIEPWVAAHDAADVSAALKKAGALWAPYQTFRELAADKVNVLDNPMFTILDQPGIGRYPVAASPMQFGAVPRQPPQPAPVLGQHTDETLVSSACPATRSPGCMMTRSLVAPDRILSPAAESVDWRQRWRSPRRASPRWCWRKRAASARSEPASSSGPTPSTVSTGSGSARPRGMAVYIDQLRLMDALADGEICHIDLGDRFRARRQSLRRRPSRRSSWRAVERLPDHPLIELRTSAEVTGYDQDGSPVVARLRNGETVTGVRDGPRLGTSPR